MVAINIVLMLLGASLIAGVVQSTTGFGAGIILMIFLPELFSVTQSAAISTATIFALTLFVVTRFRKHIRYRQILLPVLLYSVVVSVIIPFSKGFDTGKLQIALGLLLVGLACYSFLSGKRKKAVANWQALLFIVISGVFSGLFGIGGPLMAVYFLSITNSKEEYLGTIQCFFMLNGIYATALRIFNGILTVHELPVILIGIVGILVGSFIGTRILNKINIQTLGKVVYIFIGLSGLFYIFK